MARDGSGGRLWSRLGATRLFASERARRRVLLDALVLLIALAATLYLVRNRLSLLTDAERLRAFVGGFGVWAPVVVVVLQALQVVLAPVPGQVLALVSGYLFGPWWGTLYNVVGVTLGSTAAFWLSRRYGRAYVERVVHEDALARFDAIDDDHARLTLFVFFLVPGLPDDLLCFVGGLTEIPLWQLVVLAVVGRTPAFFLTNVVGDLLGTDRVGAALGLAGAVVVVSVLAYRSRERLLELVGGDGR